MATSEWSTESLAHLWTLGTFHSSMETSGIFIDGPDRFGGLEVRIIHDELVTTRSIPEHYGLGW
jgi:hypothetical protein